MNQTYKKIVPLLAVFVLLVSSQYIDAAWNPPNGSPPTNNTPVPINESNTNQLKQGDLTVRRLNAGLEVRSPQYCDDFGNNCVTAAALSGISNTASSLVQSDGYAWAGPLLIQWGKVCPPIGAGYIKYNYPIPFPTQSLQIVGSRDTRHDGATRTNFSLRLFSNTQLKASVGGQIGCTNYIAIGY